MLTISVVGNSLEDSIRNIDLLKMAYTSRQLIFPVKCSLYRARVLLLQLLHLAGKETRNPSGFRKFITYTDSKGKMGMVSAPCPWSHRTTLNQRGPRRDSARGVSSSEKLTLNYSQAVLQTNMGSCSCGLRWGEVGARSRRICPWQLLTRLRTSTGCSRSCRVLHQASS